jgi:tetratricopeptide (TPR) repeat protein
VDGQSEGLDAETLLARARALFAEGRYAAAADAFSHAAALRPTDAAAHNGVGNALKALGRIDEARAALGRAAELAPANGWYHRDLADLKHFVADDPQLAAMTGLDAGATVSDWHRIPLHFALGKAHADLARYDDAFRHWRAGNELLARRTPYDERTVLWLFRRIAAVFTAELIRAQAGPALSRPAPIFVLGMPRSGTTLVEQILSGLPGVHGAGEVPDLLLEAARLGGRDAFTEKVAAMSGEDWRAFGGRYRERLAKRAPDAARITDKMPSNFFMIGLIHLALPEARIVHLRRDPLDTCVSNFAHLFLNAPQACELGALGRYYRAYAGLMDHWRRVLPEGTMVEVEYEQLVGDLEGEARRIVAHCGLAWNAACLDIRANRRPVATLSAARVREPVDSSAIGRARPYLRHLGPLIDALGPALAKPA